MAEPVYNDTELILNSDGSVYHLSLLPKHICSTIITVGDPGRVNQVAEFFDDIEVEINKREFVTITGTYKKKRITVISTGIGPDNIEIFFNEIDALANIDLNTRRPKNRKKKLNIIRIGTSGAIQEDIRPGSFLSSEHAVGLDNTLHFYPYKPSEFQQKIAHSIAGGIALPTRPYVTSANGKLLEIFRPHFPLGNTVTCPGFYAPQGRSLRIAPAFPKVIDQFTLFHEHDFWISNLEMETAAYYAFASMLDHRAISINAILANRATGKFEKNPVKVVNKLIEKTLDIICQSDL